MQLCREHGEVLKQVSGQLADLQTNVAVLIVEAKSLQASNSGEHHAITANLAQHGDKIELLDTAIRGNGRAGLKERMGHVERFIGGLERFRLTILIATVTAVASGVVTLVIAMVHNAK